MYRRLLNWYKIQSKYTFIFWYIPYNNIISYDLINIVIFLFLASNFLRMSYDSAKACAVVETGPSSTGGISSSNLNDLNNAHSSSISDTQFSGDHQLQTFDTNGNYGLEQDSFRCKFNKLIINLYSIFLTCQLRVDWLCYLLIKIMLKLIRN